MKKLLLLATGLVLALAAQAQDTLAVIWEEQFDGGIPADWTISEGTPAGAVWQWSDDAEADDADLDGVVTDALFWGTRGPIQSPSAANGCAMFNSDVYDGGGIGVGSGPFPGTHGGSLTSPYIDCSGYDAVSLKMNQYARANANAISTIFEVSVDSGMTWTAFEINPEVVGNGGTAPDDVLILDISSVAANQVAVQLRFTWNGRYYFWLIDDVQIIETPRNNLAIGDFFYPPASFATPMSQIDTDTMGFSADVTNLGRDDRYDVVLKATVTDDAGAVLYQDSVVVDTLPAFYVDSSFVIEELYIPEGLSEGVYDINYEVYSLTESDDFDPTDNAFGEQFVITENLFAMEDGNLGGIRPGGGGDYQMGNVYRISPLAGPGFIATTLTTAGGKSAADGPIIGETVTMLMYRVKDEVLPDYSNFNDASTGDAGDPEDHLELIGFNSYEFPEGYTNYDIADVDILNIDADPGVELEPGARYFVVNSYQDDAALIFTGVDDDIEYFQVSTIVFTSNWFLGGFGPEESSAVRMTIALIDATDEAPLPETALNLYPNPAMDELTVDLDLEQQGPALIVIAGVDGKIMMMREFDNVQDENLRFDISNYPAGSYFVRVGTEEGTKTKQFVKIR